VTNAAPWSTRRPSLIEYAPTDSFVRPVVPFLRFSTENRFKKSNVGLFLNAAAQRRRAYQSVGKLAQPPLAVHIFPANLV